MKDSSSALAAPLPVFRGTARWVGPFDTGLLAGVFVWVTSPHVLEWLGAFLLAAFLFMSIAVYHYSTLRPYLFQVVDSYEVQPSCQGLQGWAVYPKELFHVLQEVLVDCA